MFTIALSNVLVTLFYIIPGYVIKKMNKATDNHLATMSAVLVYVCTPFLAIKAFLSLEFSWDMVKEMGLFFLVTLALMSCFMGILWLILRKKFQISKFRIMTIGAVMGNVGFFGLPVIQALFPENPGVACYSVTFMVSMNILVFTIGVFCITGEKKYISFRSMLMNPTTFGFVIAFPLYCLGASSFLPAVLINAINIVGNMSTPLCMIIIGIRLASMPLKKVFGRPIVYAIAALKLLAFPLFAYGIVYFLPVSQYFKASVLVLCATPCAAVINSMAEMYGKDREISANCVLLSTVMCFVTIPILTLLLP